MRQRPSRSPCASQERHRAAVRSRGRSRSPPQAASRRGRKRETWIRAARPSRRGMPLRSLPLLCDRASAESHRGRALEAALPLRERRQSCWRLVRGSKRYALTRASRRPPALDCKRFASQRATPLRAEPEGDVTTRETHATDVAACAACRKYWFTRGHAAIRRGSNRFTEAICEPVEEEGRLRRDQEQMGPSSVRGV